MADTYTTFLNLTKTGIGESEDTWGTKLNNNFDAVDALFDTGAVLKVTSGGTGATTAAQARTNLGLGSLATQTTVAESQITDGSILARVGSNETITGSWSFAGASFSGAVTFSNTAVFSGAVTFSSTVSGITVTESQITDGTILARVAGTETITGAWTFTNSGTYNFSTGTLQYKSIEVGFRAVPQNAQTGNYTCVLEDSGKHIYHASGAGAGDTYTIPANASVAYPVGTVLTFVNSATDAVSIAITSDTLTLAGTTTTGTRTLAQNGIATAIKVTSTVWIISGSGLT